MPKEAILTKNGRTSVYVYNEDTGTVQEKQVTIGLMNDAEAEIVAGLAEGELVVTSGQDRLQNDMAVKVKNADSLAESPARKQDYAAGQEASKKQDDSAGEAGQS